MAAVASPFNARVEKKPDAAQKSEDTAEELAAFRELSNGAFAASNYLAGLSRLFRGAPEPRRKRVADIIERALAQSERVNLAVHQLRKLREGQMNDLG